MKWSRFVGLSLLSAFGFFDLAFGAAEGPHPLLYPLFQDHMVLQRQTSVPVWGWAQPGDSILVSFAGQQLSTKADAQGKWMVRLHPLKPSCEPAALNVTNNTAHTSAAINDVLVGDVWLCSGQSNMEMGLQVCNATNDIAAADLPQLRLLTVPRRVSLTPVSEFAGSWLVCSPKSVQQGEWGGFSAAAFFFGRELQHELKIPIGLIHSSWGGTVAQAWTSVEALAPLGDFKADLAAVREQNANNKQNTATVLYNGMIAPLLPFAIKGAIWYQGESNAGDPAQYRRLLPAMIQDWRRRFGQGDFPFYIEQLAAFMATNSQPRDHSWAELREAQALTARTVNHSGLAVAIDIGNASDVHPKDKLSVGHRLALWALARTYGKKVAYSGPWYRSMRVEGKNIRIAFDHVEGGLVIKGDKLTGFAIAGEDRKFVWADAVIEGDSVVVSSPAVTAPVAVRYGWDANPVCDLFNQAGLPAVPFRTDQWAPLAGRP